jgi:hypothetical protein
MCERNNYFLGNYSLFVHLFDRNHCCYFIQTFVVIQMIIVILCYFLIMYTLYHCSMQKLEILKIV